MRKIFTILVALIISINIFAQAPQKMSYQAVIRNTTNELLVNKPVKMRISILQGSTTGSSVYSELHSTTTNANGLVSIEIGAGTSPTGTFSSINWGNGTYFVKTETDPNNQSNYSIVGISQLLSAPYALYAAKSGNSNIASGNKIGDMLYWNGSTWTNIPVGKPGQSFQLDQNNIPGWAGDAYAVVETLPVEITDMTAKFNVRLISNGRTSNWTPYSFSLGVCWDTLPNPFYYPNSLSDSNSVPGNYSFSLFSGAPGSSSLLPNKKYYARAYAENGAGVVFGNEVSFVTSSSFNQEELITTVQLKITESGTINTNTYSWKDVDGVGGNIPVIQGITLSPNKSYEVEVEFLDESKNPAENKTAEIRAEANDHEVFYDNIAPLDIVYLGYDKDGNGLKLGLKAKWETKNAVSGKVRLTLKHKPGGIKAAGDPVTKGETVIEVEFPVVVE